MAGIESKAIRGTEGFFHLTEPVFSPDGHSIVFHTGSDQTFKRIPVTGGRDENMPLSVSSQPELGSGGHPVH